MRGRLAEREVVVGNRRLMAQLGIGWNSPAVEAAEHAGGTVALVAVDGRFAGAIVVTDALLAGRTPAEGITEIRDAMRRLADNEAIDIDAEVASSEAETGFRNYSLANFMRGFGNLRSPVEDVLQTYFLSGRIDEKFKADFIKIPLKNGWNTFFLCSDGVLESYSDAETIQLIENERDINKLLHNIEQQTFKYSEDNSTAIIVRYHYVSPEMANSVDQRELISSSPLI